MTAVAALAFISHRDILPTMRAGPVPALKAVLNWLAAMIAVKIAAARPRDGRLDHPDLYLRARRNGLPAMPGFRIKFEGAVVEHVGMENDLPLQAPSPGNAKPDIAFLYVDD